MFKFSKKLFKSGGGGGVVSTSIFSQEFLESGVTSESSDSWATTTSSDAEDFFTAIATGSADECSEVKSFRDALESMEDVPEEDDGEARLVSVMSWVSKGYSALTFGEEEEEEESSWTVEDEKALRADWGPDPGQEKLERWMGVLKVRKRMQEREVRRERWRKAWRVVKDSVNVKRGDGDVVSQPLSKDEVQRSCASDARKVKKGNKLFRARRRVMNVFRRVERPVESVIAKERFLIE